MAQESNTSEEMELSNDYNPLMNESPIEKEYQKPNIDVNSLPKEIPTANFEKPIITFTAEEVNLNSKTEKATETPNQEQISNDFNPALNDLSSKEKRIAAENMADSAIGAYAFICEKVFVPKAQINTEKIEEQIATGEMSDKITFVVDEQGNQANIREYANVFNENVSESLEVSDEFVNKVREPLIRICQKRNFAMSDEQFVALEFGKDLLAKGMVVYELKKSTKTITNMIIEQTAMMKSSLYNKEQFNSQTEFNPIEQVKTNPEIIKTVDSNATNNLTQETFEEPKSNLEDNSELKLKKTTLPKKQFGNPEILAHLEKTTQSTPPKSNRRGNTKTIKPSK